MSEFVFTLQTKHAVCSPSTCVFSSIWFFRSIFHTWQTRAHPYFTRVQTLSNAWLSEFHTHARLQSHVFVLSFQYSNDGICLLFASEFLWCDVVPLLKCRIVFVHILLADMWDDDRFSSLKKIRVTIYLPKYRSMIAFYLWNSPKISFSHIGAANV